MSTTGSRSGTNSGTNNSGSSSGSGTDGSMSSDTYNFWHGSIYEANQSDYSSEGASSLGSYGYGLGNNGYVSTDSGRSNSTTSYASNSSGYTTSWGSASTWGWSSANQTDYDADTESLASGK